MQPAKLLNTESFFPAFHHTEELWGLSPREGWHTEAIQEHLRLVIKSSRSSPIIFIITHKAPLHFTTYGKQTWLRWVESKNSLQVWNVCHLRLFSIRDQLNSLLLEKQNKMKSQYF